MNGFELEPGEFVVRLLRKHWLLLLGEMLPYVILVVIPFALPQLLSFAPVPANIHFISYLDYRQSESHHALMIWLLITWTVAWGNFTRYFLNAWILTSQRIIHIKQRRFFSREVSSLFLSRVQDVTSDVSGVLSSIINIGTIKVQSAGEEEEFTMSGISKPEMMRDLILKYIPEEKV